MTIQVPFQLRRRAAAEPAVALFVPTRDLVDLFAICGRLGLNPARPIFNVAGGLLLQLERPATQPMPGVIRLRELAPAFYLPADADLIPALLDDEAGGMVRDWGLVFLPGGRTLLFDRHSPLELTELLKTEPRARRDWSPLPEPKRLAERVDQIMLELPEQAPDAFYRELKQELQQPGSRAKDSKRKDKNQPDAAGGTAGDCRADKDGAEVSEASSQDGAGAPGADGGAADGGALPGGPHFVETLHDLVARARQALSAWQERSRSSQDHDSVEGSEVGASEGVGSSTIQTIGRVFQYILVAPIQFVAILKEKVQWEWVDHSALLRKLVREFRDGDPAQALRRAIPFAKPDELTVPARALWLPFGRAIYNLGELLRRAGRGEAMRVLPAQEDVLRELAAEYRKAADRAVKQGDFRRAAYICGILLRDDRAAANAMQRGGLNHDAAILYLKKLNDPGAAAQAFEAAGEVDRALALYRQLDRHEPAGDLLRRIGDEDTAVAEYQLAADALAALSPADHLGAGRLLLEKARRPDLAIEHLQAGWRRRPAENAALCALELARLHGERGAIGPIHTLLDQADGFFDSGGSDSEAAGFYNGMVAICGTQALAPFADDVRDRVLLSLARRLRQGVEAGHSNLSLVSTLLGRTKLWPASLVSDADFAANAALKSSRGRASSDNRDPRVQGIQIGRGVVTAVGQASVSGEIFLGFDNGLVVGYLPERNQVVQVADDTNPVTALAVDPEGRTVVTLRKSGRGTSISRSLRRPDGSFRSRPESHLPVHDRGAQGPERSTKFRPGLDDESQALPEYWLTPIVSWGVERLVGIGDGHELVIIDAASGLRWARLTIVHHAKACPTTAFLLATGSPKGAAVSRLVVLTDASPRWILVDEQGKLLHQALRSHWLPPGPGLNPVRAGSIAWRHFPPFLELVRLDQSGAVYAAQFYIDDGSLELLAERFATTEGGYLAAARAGTNTVVAVSRTGIDWLGYGADRFHRIHKLKLSFPTAVACFASSATQETLVICSDGSIARVASPRRLGTVTNER